LTHNKLGVESAADCEPVVGNYRIKARFDSNKIKYSEAAKYSLINLYKIILLILLATVPKIF